MDEYVLFRYTHKIPKYTLFFTRVLTCLSRPGCAIGFGPHVNAACDQALQIRFISWPCCKCKDIASQHEVGLRYTPLPFAFSACSTTMELWSHCVHGISISNMLQCCTWSGTHCFAYFKEMARAFSPSKNRSYSEESVVERSIHRKMSQWISMWCLQDEGFNFHETCRKFLCRTEGFIGWDRLGLMLSQQTHGRCSKALTTCFALAASAVHTLVLVIVDKTWRVMNLEPSRILRHAFHAQQSTWRLASTGRSGTCVRSRSKVNLRLWGCSR